MAADPTSAALEHVLQRFGAMLARAGLERGLGAAELDDLRQDVRIRLWRALEQGERIESIPASYVQRTAVTAALDLIRRRRARRTEPLVEPRDTGDKPIGPSAQVSGPDREFDRDELAECVAGAVDGLADARRVVVRLYLAGYPREEIAGLLGWSEPKTRNLLYRGLTDLRTRLTELGVGPGRIEIGRASWREGGEM